MPVAAALLLTTLALGTDALVDLEARSRLSVAWSRAAVGLIAEPSRPIAASFLGALDVSLAAAELMPNNSQGWRVVQGIAEATDESLPAGRAAMKTALDQLGRLEPNDQLIRLGRLCDAAERGTASDERVAAFDKLLQPSARQRIGNAIASRLAFELSLLCKRRGDMEGWTRWLKESVQLDASFPSAAQALAGYEVGSGDGLDKVSAALVTAIAADPGNTGSLNALARICLHEGLYSDAERLLDLAIRIASFDLDYMLVDDLIADRMVALWGMGRHEDANKIAQERQAELNALLRRRMGDATATDKREDEVGPRVTLPSALACVRAAVCRSGSLPNAEATLRDALASLDNDAKQAGDDAAAVAAVKLRKAWMQVTIGDPEEVQPLLDEADRAAPLSDVAKARFAGWLKIRRNQPDKALADLQPIAESDAGAKVGVGMALMAMGRTKDAAATQLAVARANRENAVGVYAADRLFDLVKARPGPTNESKAVQEAVARMPKPVWDLARDQAQAIACMATFGLPQTAFDSLPLTVTVQNRSGLTLAIDSDGPIESRAALLLEASVIGKRPLSLPPWIFPIDRQLELKPLETLSFELDMARTPLADVLLGDPLSGALISTRMVTNFRLTADRVQAGFLGNIGDSGVLRIPAVRVNAGWREDVLSEIRHPDRSEDLVKLVMLAYDLANRSTTDAAVDNDPAWKDINDAWMRLPPAAQAWTLMVLPRSKLVPMATLLEAARSSTDESVRMSYLLRWVDTPDDVTLAAAIRSGGRLATTAESVKALLQSKALDAADVNQSLEDAGVFGTGSSTPR